MSDGVERRILIAGASALARSATPDEALHALLEAIAQPLDIGSAAVVLPREPSGAYRIVASLGLDTAAAAGLAGAIARPGHPIARTFVDPVATYDVTPINPGGPALRSHLPLVVRADGRDVVVGVLALAYDRPIAEDTRPVIEAVADLAAVVISRRAPGSR